MFHRLGSTSLFLYKITAGPSPSETKLHESPPYLLMKFTILLAALFVLNLQLSAIDFRITDLTHGNQGQPEVRFTAATDYYYILYRGDHPSDVTTAATLGLGLNGGRLSDPTRLLEISQFYRLRQVPLDQPLDLDADGIDDVYELSHQDFLNPLNPADANESFTPSLTKLDEYLLQRDPNRVPQVFVNNATISCGDTRYDGRHIVVNGATLTLDCVHTFKSLTVTNGGVVTHSAGLSNGLKLTITETVFVSSNSALSFSAKGYAPGQGPGTGIAGSYAGGGGHGGRGGNGSSGGQGGGTYGSVSEPTDFGSGSGGGSSHGGGSMCLWVGGNLHVDGTISADGQTSGGGGSGGSLWLQTSRLSGSGLISANGGDANSSSGGGGGGRIAIYSRTNDFSGQVQALGGSGRELGGAGTIYFKTGTAALGTLVIANRRHENRGSQPTELAGVWTLDALIIETNGWLSHPVTNALDLIASNVIVKAGGFLSLNAKGYAPGQGPGTGIAGSYSGGGGHGGLGGNGSSGGMGGGAYGSLSEPTDFGSGSGGGNAGGGGALRLRVSGELQVDGTISADGQTSGGGGSGGSLWLQTSRLSGSGLISANGGDANSSSGGGGGGRIAIYSRTNDFSGQVQALGGSGRELGGAGTIYFKTGTAALGTLVIANRWHENRGSQPTELAGVWTFDALIIESNGWLSHPLTNALDLIASNVDVKAGGFLSLNAKGYAPGQGPGAGNMIGYGGGGGYGGDGGSGTSGGLGGAAYGSMANPTDFGSGGGNAWGGGALRLRVSQELTVNGIISANGQTTGGKSVGGNGGAGGSLWLEAGKLIGRGVISANGGNANTINAGGGGGGRIAIYTKCAPDLGMLTVEALGGTGQAYGEVGTIYFGIHESGLIGATSFAGDITSIATPPSVDFQQLTNSQTMFFFSEQTNVTLGFPLAANITSPGRYDSQAALHDSLGHIPSGTPISSYYIHFDTGLTNKAESEVSLTNTLTFDSEILGVILLTPQLITSDSAVGNLATVYPSLELNSLRGFEVGENIGQDWVELHADRRTITISARVRDWADQLRIITSAYNRCED